MEEKVNSKSRLMISPAFLIAILTILYSCSKAPDYIYIPGYGGNPKGTGEPGENEVWIQGIAFYPSTVAVLAGNTIKWTNKDAVAHTVTSDNGLFDSGSIGTGGTFNMQFNNTGTYTYHCSLHPGIIESIIVN